MCCMELLQVDLKFTLGEEKTIVSSKIAVYPRIEGMVPYLILENLLKVWNICSINIQIIYHFEYLFSFYF